MIIMKLTKLFGVTAGGYLLAVGIGVIMGVISYVIIANATWFNASNSSWGSPPTGINALVISYIPTFFALAIMMLPVGALWIGGMA